MTRTTKTIARTLLAALVAAALAPAASVAAGGGASGQHDPAPTPQGGGAYGQHLSAASQEPSVQSPTVANDSSSGFGWGDGAMVGGGVLVLIALGGLVVRVRKSRLPALSS